MNGWHEYSENNPGVNLCATCGRTWANGNHLPKPRQRKSIVDSEAYELGFRAGWQAGYHDGGEHDCRMFEPTEDRAWEHHVFEKTGRTK
jgi:hypothetical protein